MEYKKFKFKIMEEIIMKDLKQEILDGTHDKVLGIVSLAVYGVTAYALSGIVHKIKNKRKNDQALIKGFFTGYDMNEKMHDILKKDEKK